MERREGFFERRRRVRSEKEAIRDAAFSALEQQLRASLNQSLEQSRAALQAEIRQLQESERRKAIRHQVAGTLELGILGKQGEATLVIPGVRDQYLNMIRLQILHLWRTSSTVSVQDEVAQATSLIGIDEPVSGFDLRGIKYPIKKEPSENPEEDRYITEADLRAIFVATGASIEETRRVFKETQRR